MYTMRKTDFIIIFSLNALLIALMALGEMGLGGILGFLRAALGLFFVLFPPGYALQAALLPRREQLGTLERLALSFGLSLAILPVLGLLLDGQIFLWQSTLFLTGFTLLTGIVALYRRSRAAREEVQAGETESSLGAEWFSLKALQKARLALLVLAVLSGLGLALFTIFTPQPYTEFSLLGDSDIAENYPLEVRAGEQFTLKAGVQNHEGRDATYSIQVALAGQPLAGTAAFEVPDGEQVTLALPLTAPTPGNGQRLEITLLRAGQVYRRLYLRLDVK